MKKLFLISVFLLVFVPEVPACVGKTLTVGITNTTEEMVLAQMLSTLVNERTGTTVNIAFFDTPEDIYTAVREKKVDISIENTSRALHILNMPHENDAKKAYTVVKATYEKEKGLIWLKPFGFTNINGAKSPSYTATILRMDILNNFPALPRLFNKLGSTINDQSYTKLIQAVEAGKEPKSVAKDFLKSKKLI